MTSSRRKSTGEGAKDGAAASRHRREPDPFAARIGRRIRERRTAAELTFDAFVEKAGLGRGYVSELERGLVVPTVGTLARVARVLGLTVADLVCGDSTRERCFEELRLHPVARIRALLEQLVAERKQRRPGGT